MMAFDTFIMKLKFLQYIGTRYLTKRFLITIAAKQKTILCTTYNFTSLLDHQVMQNKIIRFTEVYFNSNFTYRILNNRPIPDEKAMFCSTPYFK